MLKVKDVAMVNENAHFTHLASGIPLHYALRRANPAILEDDLFTFGSGYVKETIWRYIRRYLLTSTDVARI
jgi:hypothetical protein